MPSRKKTAKKTARKRSGQSTAMSKAGTRMSSTARERAFGQQGTRKRRSR